MANTHGSLQSPPAGDSQVFDVGQQKDMLRATGNSPTEHLNCRELPGSLGKAGRRKWGSWENSKEQTIQQEALASTGTIRRAFVLSHQDLLITAAHPRVTAASLPLSLPYTRQHCATQRTRGRAHSSLTATACFHSLPGSTWGASAPTPSSQTLKSDDVWKE